jgi:hypothetical protein
MSDPVSLAESALRLGRRVTLTAISDRRAAAHVGLDMSSGAGNSGAAQAWMVEVFGPNGEILHRGEVDADGARRLLVAGAIEI